MSKSALLDYIPESRRATIYHEESGKTWVESRQDVSAVIKAASILADEKPGKDFRHVALIPETVLNQAFLEGWFHDEKAWTKWANDPDNECYRTWKGRV